MNVLFDHGTPAPLRTFLKDHTVKDAKSQGWDTFGNGDLLVAAETAALSAHTRREHRQTGGPRKFQTGYGG